MCIWNHTVSKKTLNSKASLYLMHCLNRAVFSNTGSLPPQTLSGSIRDGKPAMFFTALPEHCPNICPALQPISLTVVSPGCNPSLFLCICILYGCAYICIPFFPFCSTPASRSLPVAYEWTCLRLYISTGVWTWPIDLFTVRVTAQFLKGGCNRTSKYLSKRSAVRAGETACKCRWAKGKWRGTNRLCVSDRNRVIEENKTSQEAAAWCKATHTSY